MAHHPNVLRGAPARTGAATGRQWVSVVFGTLVAVFFAIALVGLLRDPFDSDSVPAAMVSTVILGLGVASVLTSVASLRRITGLDVTIDGRGISLSDGRTWPWSDLGRVEVGTRHGNVADRLRVRFTDRRRRRVVLLRACAAQTVHDLLEQHRPGVTSGPA